MRSGWPLEIQFSSKWATKPRLKIQQSAAHYSMVYLGSNFIPGYRDPRRHGKPGHAARRYTENYRSNTRGPLNAYRGRGGRGGDRRGGRGPVLQDRGPRRPFSPRKYQNSPAPAVESPRRSAGDPLQDIGQVPALLVTLPTPAASPKNRQSRTLSLVHNEQAERGEVDQRSRLSDDPEGAERSSLMHNVGRQDRSVSNPSATAAELKAQLLQMRKRDHSVEQNLAVQKRKLDSSPFNGSTRSGSLTSQSDWDNQPCGRESLAVPCTVRRPSTPPPPFSDLSDRAGSDASLLSSLTTARRSVYSDQSSFMSAPQSVYTVSGRSPSVDRRDSSLTDVSQEEGPLERSTRWEASYRYDAWPAPSRRDSGWAEVVLPESEADNSRPSREPMTPPRQSHSKAVSLLAAVRAMKEQIIFLETQLEGEHPSFPRHRSLSFADHPNRGLDRHVIDPEQCRARFIETSDRKRWGYQRRYADQTYRPAQPGFGHQRPVGDRAWREREYDPARPSFRGLGRSTPTPPSRRFDPYSRRRRY